MREKLRNARRQNQLKQEEVANKLHITTRQYQRIEKGTTVGRVEMWDKLEDLFQISQRQLRENTKRPDTIR